MYDEWDCIDTQVMMNVTVLTLSDDECDCIDTQSDDECMMNVTVLILK